MIHALVFLLFFIPTTILFSIMAIIGSFIGRSGRLPDMCARGWARTGLLIAGVKVKAVGTENIPRNEPVIFMGNHQGNFDILSLYAANPVRFAWVAKEELFRIPVFGHSMSRAGYIPIDRSDGRRAMKSVEMAAQRIRSGTSVVIFPEGTRSDDGNLLPFKRGGFLLAGKAEVPIVPFTIIGSNIINPPEGLLLRSGRITIQFGEPITTAGERTEAMMEKVRAAIAAPLQAP